jgi:predicted DNA-binding transcriptional regulator YafY
MSETSSRLLELLSPLQGRRDCPGNELADRLEVSDRTIRRDIGRLRRLGYPVESLTGPAGGYQLRAGSAMPSLLLDDEEAIAWTWPGRGRFCLSEWWLVSRPPIE